ncbi:MAG: Hpt domain-containing protein [Anaerolineales bacterium]
MVKKTDEDVLAGFLDEARGYLPIILERLEAFRADPQQSTAIKEAFRYSHTIKGTASMIELPGLSLIASYLEEVLEDFVAGKRKMGKQAFGRLHKLVTQIETFLGGIVSGELDERRLIEDATIVYRRMQRLPKAEDQTAIEEALRKIAKNVESTLDVEFEPVVSTPDDAQRHEDVSPELLNVFRVESEEHMRNVGSLLVKIVKEPSDVESLQAIRRSVHTLKGAAGSVGLLAVAQLTHRMEDVLDRFSEASMPIDTQSMDLMFDSADALEDLVSGDVEASAMQNTLHDLYGRYTDLLGDDIEEPLSPQIELFGEGGILDLETLPTLTEKSVGAFPAMTRASRKPSKIVRVPLERLDELVKLVSELVISRSAFELRMKDFTREVDELRLSSERLRRLTSTIETNYEVRALGGRISMLGGTRDRNAANETGMVDAGDFDELQFDRYTEFHLLSRELTETSSDIRTMGTELFNLIAEFDGILTRHRRLSTQIQDELMRTRMVPLATLATRFYRTVRVLSREQEKLVDLIIEGEEIEMDTTVLDAIVDPLLHLLRNAVDHGIETPEVRKSKGKPERGRIDLRAYNEGNQVVIQVRDDGAGLDLQAIRSVAVREGYVTDTEVQNLSDAEIYTFVFMPGFSTADEVSEVSGRGVGLDVVCTNVENLKGTLAIDSAPGEYTLYTIRLPMTLAVTRAILVKVNEETFAIPLSAVSQILRLEEERIETAGKKPGIRLGDRVVPLRHLGEALGLGQSASDIIEHMPLLILKVGDQEIGLVVDQLLTGREIVIKTLGTHLRRVHGVTGATLMGDGSVVLILNPADLITGTPQAEVQGRARDRATAVEDEGSLIVMIVDDSLSVRRVVSKLVTHAGWQPLAAKDGIEALEILQQASQLPDLILVDIEMPRMDGFELMSTLKAHENYKNIPLVVLTSRAGGKHRSKALEIGAAEYLVKPYQEDEVLRIIRNLVHQSQAVST